MTFSLKIVKGAEQAEGVAVEVRLPEPLSRFTVGRDPGNDWPIPDRTRAISARHFEFVRAGGRTLLRDVSTNGTFLNGAATRMAGDHVLADGDRIELGPYLIVAHREAAAAPAEPTTGGVTAAPMPATPAARAAGLGAAALRGGDPAAMLAAGLPDEPEVRLTEILRVAPPVESADVAVTRIRVAPKPTLAAPPTILPAAKGPAADPVLAALAAGLGVPIAALAGRDAASAARQVAVIARAALGALRLAHGAHEGDAEVAASAGRAANPLFAAPDLGSAIAALLAPTVDAAALIGQAATPGSTPPAKTEGGDGR